MAAARARRHLRILGQYARIGVIRKSQLRFEFLNQVVMDTLWYASHVAVFEVLFAHAPTLAGWRRDEVRVFLGFLFASDAFMMMWLGQAWQFGSDLKNGNIDSIRIRPASPIVQYFFKSFSLEAGANMTIALSYLGYALAHAGSPGLALARLPYALLLTWWSQVVLRVLFSIIEFYLLNSDLGEFLREMFMAVEDRPLEIFSRRVKLFFLFVVPIGAMAQVPASLVLGKTSMLHGLFYGAFLVAFGSATFRLWTWSLRRYESAMS